jgi:hypothetical protein
MTDLGWRKSSRNTPPQRQYVIPLICLGLSSDSSPLKLAASSLSQAEAIAIFKLKEPEMDFDVWSLQNYERYEVPSLLSYTISSLKKILVNLL